MHHTITNKFLILIDVPFITKTWRKVWGGICFIKGVILSGCESSWIAFFQYLVDVLHRNIYTLCSKIALKCSCTICITNLIRNNNTVSGRRSTLPMPPLLPNPDRKGGIAKMKV